MFPYLTVAELPDGLMLISEPPPQHRVGTGHIVPSQSKTPNYFYIIPILLSIYLKTLCLGFDCCCTQSRYFHWHWAIHK